MESLEMTESRVMSETPTCFFLKPSFQSACTQHYRVSLASRNVAKWERECATLTKLLPAAAFFAGTAALEPFFTPFRVGAYVTANERLPARESIQTHHLESESTAMSRSVLAASNGARER